MSDGHSLQNYFLLRGALLRHQKFPWHLSETEQSALAQAAAREMQLATRVLRLSLSQEVKIAEESLQQTVAEFLQGVSALGSVDDVLREAGLSRSSLSAAMAAEMVVAEVVERITASVAPSEEEVYHWYQSHPEQFIVPERREVFQILITINDEYAENRREVAWQRIDEVVGLAQARPELFGTLAMSHSECPSAVESGRLGVVPPGILYPELDRVLFTLESGAISHVVESPLGFHLLRCGEIEPAQRLDWEEVKEPLTQRLAQYRLKNYLKQHQMPVK